MDEKLEIIHSLETKNKQYSEEKSYIAKKYQLLKQQFLNMVFLIFRILLLVIVMINMYFQLLV